MDKTTLECRTSKYNNNSKIIVKERVNFHKSNLNINHPATEKETQILEERPFMSVTIKNLNNSNSGPNNTLETNHPKRVPKITTTCLGLYLVRQMLI